MEAYPKTARVNNLGLAPALPVYRAPLGPRLASSVRQCRGEWKHKGRARRQRREVQTRQDVAWLAGLRSGAGRVSDGGGRSYALRVLLGTDWRTLPGWHRSLLAKARNLVTLAERHGPRSGWGLRQGAAGEQGNPKWTPYYVPKAAERCWRFWRRVCRALRAVLRALARALSHAVPLHRSLLEQEPAGKDQSSSLEAPAERVPVYRDHSAQPWGPALERLRQRLAM